MIASYLRSLGRKCFRRARTNVELNDELGSHIQLRIDDLVRSGCDPAQAERQARIEFGNTERIKEECREQSGGRFIDNLIQDVRFSFRMLRKSPGFTVVAVITIGLGLGATTTIFSVLDSVVLKPLPYPHPEQLVSVEVTPLALDPSLRGIAPEHYFVFGEQNHTFQDFGIYAETDTDRDVNVTSFGEPQRVLALSATHNVLSLLGIPALVGRLFQPADDDPAAPPTAVLTYTYWKRQFGGDPSAIGKTIVVDGTTREIIGVLPRNFRFLDLTDLALILPVQLDRSKTQLGQFSYFGIARLKPGISLAEARRDVDRMLPITLDTFPPRAGLSLDLLKSARLTPSILPLKQEVVGNVGTLLWTTMGGIGVVLLIACANVANLLLVRTDSRQRELAVRAALGASRRRIAVQLLRESAIIGLLGSVAGLAFAWLALRLLVNSPPAGLPRIGDVSINSAVLYFTVGLTLLTSLLFALIPALKYSRVGGGALESQRVIGTNRERHRSRNFLVATQIALAVVLLVCAGLMIRTFLVLTHVHPGFARPAELQTFSISMSNSDASDDAAVARMEGQIQDKLATIPGVSAVAFSSAVPLDEDARLDNVFAEDRVQVQGAAPPLRHLVFVSPRYFETLGMPLIAGRDLTWTDIDKRMPVALISENLAREYWGTAANALGKRIRIRTTDDWREIIGVVGDVHDAGLDKPARTNVYWPVLQSNFSGQASRAQRVVTFVIRSSFAGSENLMKQVRAAVWSVDPNLPLSHVYTLNYFYLKSVARTSFTLVMLGIAGAMALLLAAVGIYGVIAYSISQRTQEIGIRMALGAQRSDVMRLFVGEGVLLVAIGLMVGLTSSFGVTRLLSSLVFGVSTTDPFTFAGVALLMGMVALLACHIPARRAMRVDPLIGLRCE